MAAVLFYEAMPYHTWERKQNQSLEGGRDMMWESVLGGKTREVVEGVREREREHVASKSICMRIIKRVIGFWVWAEDRSWSSALSL